MPKIHTCPKCGGLVLGFAGTMIGKKEHKRCPKNPTYLEEVEEE